jgi:hypothetical protein
VKWQVASLPSDEDFAAIAQHFRTHGHPYNLHSADISTEFIAMKLNKLNPKMFAQ